MVSFYDPITVTSISEAYIGCTYSYSYCMSQMYFHTTVHYQLQLKKNLTIIQLHYHTSHVVVNAGRGMQLYSTSIIGRLKSGMKS